jgi:hypothetical protein
MRLWDHLWAGIFVSLAIGTFLIGTGVYYYPWLRQQSRERDRLIKEGLSGVNIPAPDQEQLARAWRQDMLAGATLGAVLWIIGNIVVFGKAWRERKRGRQDQREPT